MSATAPRIAVVDYGAGNLKSVAKALVRAGLEPCVTGDAAIVRDADGVVLPGVGAFADAAANLRERGLDDALKEVLQAGRPYLGLCLGLQVLFDESDEHGVTAGFGVIPGRVERFPDSDAAGAQLRVPHIGWNTVRFNGSHPMLERLPKEDCYYFVHSYRVVPKNPGIAVGTTDYGGEFTSAIAKDGMFAVQFHPEKSQTAGKRVLDAFASWITA
jgi:glutamine amidotransferase